MITAGVIAFFLILFVIVLLSIFFEEWMRIRRIRKLGSVVEKANGSLLLGLPPEFQLDIPDLTIPGDVRLSRIQRAEMEFKVISLKGNVIIDRSCKHNIRDLLGTIEENRVRIESLSKDNPANEKEIKGISRKDRKMVGSIDDLERRMDRNLEDFREKMKVLSENGISIRWFRDMEPTLDGKV